MIFNCGFIFSDFSGTCCKKRKRAGGGEGRITRFLLLRQES